MKALEDHPIPFTVLKCNFYKRLRLAYICIIKLGLLIWVRYFGIHSKSKHFSTDIETCALVPTFNSKYYNSANLCISMSREEKKLCFVIIIMISGPLEIEKAKNDWILIIQPQLEWGKKEVEVDQHIRKISVDWRRKKEKYVISKKKLEKKEEKFISLWWLSLFVCVLFRLLKRHKFHLAWNINFLNKY